MPMNIFISAGDPSGDIHAANLAQALKVQCPAARITALGGDRIKEVADTFIADIVGFSGFGFFKPFQLYFSLKKIFKDISNRWDTERPEKVILVDYYGFNIHLAEEARRRDIPVFYYVSPQVWASRPGRIRRLAKVVTKMLVILPFEEKLYRDAGVDAVFVGNPLIDMVPDPEERSAGSKPVIGLFPGSRPSVLKKHLPVLFAAAEIIRKTEEVDIRVFALPSARGELSGIPYPVIIEADYKERQKLVLAITTSGTVSLENALLGIPMVVMYRLSSFNYFLARLLVRIKFITMVNIMAGRAVVPELIQNDATPENIARRALTLLQNADQRELVRKELLSFRHKLGAPGVSARTAAIILHCDGTVKTVHTTVQEAVRRKFT